MSQVATILISLLGMAGGAWAQSLLDQAPSGTLPGASPYDPPRPLPFKKHDHVQILFAAPFEMLFAITAEVADIRPNGTLVLKAVRKSKVNGEDETVALTAEVAPPSIESGKVRWEKLANLHLVREGGGRK